jgi:hypothetical protein
MSGEKFKGQFFDASTLDKLAEVEQLVNSVNHRPIHPASELHGAFVRKLRDQILCFTKENPQLDFTEELSNLTIDPGHDLFGGVL